MKTLKIALCAIFVLCGGVVFAACGSKKEFDVSDINISHVKEYTYDGKSHIVGVTYEGVKANVTYALSTNKNNFKPASSYNFVDAGTYNLYYRISAKGYKTFTSAGTLELTILPKEIEIDLNDYELMKSDTTSKISPGYISSGIIERDGVYDTVPINVEVVGEFDRANVDYGDTYRLTCTTTNSNYKIVTDGSNMVVKDYIHIANADGSVKQYYGNIQDAIDNAEDGETIVLNNNVYVRDVINVHNSVKIDGQGKYTVMAHKRFNGIENNSKTNASIFNIANVAENASVELTLKDVTVNGNEVARAVSAFTGKVVVENATITNGKKVDNYRSGGVYISNSASFEMKSGAIYGNDANDNEYTKYCADLWIGANANGSLCSVSGGRIENVFVNSNSFAAVEAGKFVLDGGNIENVYVEYDSGYGAVLDYKSGNIEHLYMALLNGKCNYYGVNAEVEPVAGTVYNGGKLVYVESDVAFLNETFDGNIDSMLEDGKDYIFENCTFNTAISSSKKVGLIFNNCTFTTTADSTNLYLTSVNNLIINNSTFNGTTTGGFAIDVNLYSATCDNIVIANNVFNTTSTDDNGAISIKARLGKTDTPMDIPTSETVGIIGLVEILGNDFNEDNQKVFIGVGPQGLSSAANLTTGDFDVLIKGNLDSVSIHNKFVDNKFDLQEDPTIITILPNGVYDSTEE